MIKHVRNNYKKKTLQPKKKNFFELKEEKEDSYKLENVDNFNNGNYIKGKSNGDRIKSYQSMNTSMKLSLTSKSSLIVSKSRAHGKFSY